MKQVKLLVHKLYEDDESETMDTVHMVEGDSLDLSYRVYCKECGIQGGLLRVMVRVVEVTGE